MTELTPTQRRALRARAHHLKPVVAVAGNGLTPAVLAEIERNLAAHELIKVRVYGEDRHQRTEIMAAVCEQTGAAAVQHIGNVLVLWRENPPPVPQPAPRRPAVRAVAPRKPAPRKPAAKSPERSSRKKRTPSIKRQNQG